MVFCASLCSKLSSSLCFFIRAWSEQILKGQYLTIQIELINLNCCTQRIQKVRMVYPYLDGTYIGPNNNIFILFFRLHSKIVCVEPNRADCFFLSAQVYHFIISVVQIENYPQRIRFQRQLRDFIQFYILGFLEL